MISAEEVFELRFNHPDWVAMHSRQHFDAYVGERTETLAMDQIHFLTANLKLAPANP